MRPFLTLLAAFSIAALCCAAPAGAQSVADGFDPDANGPVNDLVLQPDGKIVIAGEFSTLGSGGNMTTRNRIARLNVDGSIDAGFNPGAQGGFGVAGLALQPDGKILVVGSFGALGGGTGTTPRAGVGRLNPDGSVDTTFDPGANSYVYKVAVQPDGKILVIGAFTMFGGGGTGTSARTGIGRLNADGSLDTGFNPIAVNTGDQFGDVLVFTLAQQADGKILFGGNFTELGGATRNRIARLNRDGSLDTSFNPGTNVTSDTRVVSIAVQPDQKIVVAGVFAGLGGGTGTTPRNHIGRLNADGSVDLSFNPGATVSGAQVSVVTVQPDGKILAGGYFFGLGGGNGSTPRSHIGRLNADGSVDAGFNPGANNSVAALVVHPDGKILVGGGLYMTTLGGGGAGTTTRNRIGRLYADGSLDADFNPGANGSVYALALLPDGNIVVGGGFDTLATYNIPNFGRLRPNGSRDPSSVVWPNGPVNALAVQADAKVVLGGSFTQWNDGVAVISVNRSNIGRILDWGPTDFPFEPGADGPVNAVALQADGKILVGGAFSTLSGQEAYNIGRLNPDGSYDPSFVIWTNGAVRAIAVQPDGKILVGGEFTNLHDENYGAGVTRNRIGRINANGSLDYTFDPGADGPVNTLVVQRDGKILVGGAFSTLGSSEEYNLGRLNADGSVDTSFALWPNEQVFALALQSDGKILVGGAFTNIYDDNNSVLLTRPRIARLNPEGSVDTSFDPGANHFVYSLALQADGKVLAGGQFTMLGGGATTPRGHIARLTNSGAAMQRLRVTNGGSVVRWSRSGAAPEVWRVTFESSTDGVTYTSLGAATRVADGWRLSGQSLPINQNFYIRARGYYATGLRNGSGSIVESIVRTVAQTAVPFTDNVVTAGTTTVRAVHMIELRARINALRLHFGLASYAYTDAALTPATAIVRTSHVNDLRTALAQAYAAAGQPAPIFTDPVLVPATIIKAVHVAELRDAVAALEP